MLNFDFLFGMLCGFMVALVLGFFAVTEYAILTSVYETVARPFYAIARKIRGLNNGAAFDAKNFWLSDTVSPETVAYDTPGTFTSTNEPLFKTTTTTTPLSERTPAPVKPRRGRTRSSKKTPFQKNLSASKTTNNDILNDRVGPTSGRLLRTKSVTKTRKG